MEKTIKNAFTYMFKDSDWKYKLLILLMLQLPSIIIGSLSILMPEIFKGPTFNDIIYIILLAVLSFISNIICSGYFVKIGNNIIYCDKNSTETDVLPKWENNFFQFFKLGGLFYFATLLFLLGISLLGILGGIFFTILMPISIIIFLVFVIILPFYLYLVEAIISVFYASYDVTSFFKIKKVLKLAFYDGKKYFKIISIIGLISILIALIQNIFMKTFVIYLIMPILQTYFFLVSTYLTAILFPAKPEIFFAQA